jgi:hypothetical protein
MFKRPFDAARLSYVFHALAVVFLSDNSNGGSGRRDLVDGTRRISLLKISSCRSLRSSSSPHRGECCRIRSSSRRTIALLGVSPILFLTSALFLQVAVGQVHLMAPRVVIAAFGRVPEPCSSPCFSRSKSSEW